MKVSIATRMVKMKKKKKKKHTHTKIPSTVEKNHWNIHCWRTERSLVHHCGCWQHLLQLHTLTPVSWQLHPWSAMCLQTSVSKQPWKWPTCPPAVEIRHILWCLHKWLKKKKPGGGAMHTGMQQYEQISSNAGKTSWSPLRKVKKQESHSTWRGGVQVILVGQGDGRGTKGLC